MLVKGDTPKESLKDFDFSVISFFKPTDLESVEIDGFFEGAQKHFNKKLEDKAWSDRSLGWFRVNLDETPELAILDAEKPNQVVVGSGLSRPLNFKKIDKLS